MTKGKFERVIVVQAADGTEVSRHLESALRSRPFKFNPLLVSEWDGEPEHEDEPEGSDIGYCREATVRRVLVR